MVGEVAGEHPDELLEVADERGVAVHLHAEVLERRHARRAGKSPGGSADEILVDAGDRAVLGDSMVEKRASSASRPVACSPSHASAVQPSSTMIATIAASSQASRPGATWRWKSASSAVSVTRGSMTTIDRSASLAIAFNVVRAWGMPWLIHGFLPMKNATSHSSNSPRTALPNISAVDPDLPALLLGDGAAAVPAAEPLVQRGAVGPAEMVSLPAAAVVEDLVAAVLVADGAEPLGHLADRGVPVDLLVRAVVTATQRVAAPARPRPFW